ncbi:uncharacterized protein [Antedon mediterranea]|uniref:uncharacterized protein n=1 Tax=Antedon mediterranea TaxID=105859 RepID=UPI003AF9297B
MDSRKNKRLSDDRRYRSNTDFQIFDVHPCDVASGSDLMSSKIGFSRHEDSIKDTRIPKKKKQHERSLLDMVDLAGKSSPLFKRLHRGNSSPTNASCQKMGNHYTSDTRQKRSDGSVGRTTNLFPTIQSGSRPSLDNAAIGRRSSNSIGRKTATDKKAARKQPPNGRLTNRPQLSPPRLIETCLPSDEDTHLTLPSINATGKISKPSKVAPKPPDLTRPQNQSSSLRRNYKGPRQ